MRANGHINIPNVGSESECIGLTYTIRGAKSQKKILEIADKLDKLHNEESFVNLDVTHLGEEIQTIVGKYKVKACGSDKKARTIKGACDKFLKTIGGQTSLDPPEDSDE